MTETNSQIHHSDTVLGKHNQVNLQSGVYLAAADTSKTSGFKVYNTDAFYFLGSFPIITMAEVDKIYKDYIPYMNSHVLVFKFNKKGTKKWSAFTEKHRGEQVALLLKDTLVYTATIIEKIWDGIFWLAGGLSETEVDNFKILFEKEIRQVKSQ